MIKGMLRAMAPLGLFLGLLPLVAYSDELKTELLFEMTVNLDPPQLVGNTPSGGRRILYVKGGTFSGPKVKGEVLPGGGDWILVRSDGVFVLDGRLTLRTDDGQLIYLSFSGLFDAPPEVLQRMQKGEAVDPSEYYFRTTPVFEAAGEKTKWLNRVLGVAVGRRTATSVLYSVYVIR